MNRRLPPWLTVRLPRPETIKTIDEMVKDAHLHTVCESARCPNLPECWHKRTATLMIMGDICTRSCGFCAIKTGKPMPLDPDEPRRVAEIASKMGLKHVVLTSVDRDELKDGGSNHFAETIIAVHEAIPNVIVEVLTPDFKGDSECVANVVRAKPEIFNHNVETVPRLHHIVRPQAQYQRSLGVLKTAKSLDPEIYTKSGLMLGLGETKEEIIQVLKDLRSNNVDCVTIGQYLRPTMKHLPVIDYVTPDEFAEYEVIGKELGFAFVASSPFVRSSYNAIEFSKKVMSERLAKIQ